jgi:DNA end-binding protein Ku
MVSFGLVNIPVGLYPATEDKNISFHLLHKEDLGQVKNQRVCSRCGKVVAFSDLVKGFEYAKGEHIVMTEEDFAKATVPSNDSIAIEDFVAPSQINPVFYETPYYVQPDKKSAAAYALLYRALKETGRVGIAKVAFRTKERLAALVAGEEGLVLYTMHFADEIREAEPMPQAPAVGERELKMAEMLIESMSTEFKPEKYKDTYGEALLEVINSKREGHEVEAAERHAEATNVIDLMQILKASIEKSEAKRGGDKEITDEKKEPARKLNPEKPRRTRAKAA